MDMSFALRNPPQARHLRGVADCAALLARAAAQQALSPTARASFQIDRAPVANQAGGASFNREVADAIVNHWQVL